MHTGDINFPEVGEQERERTICMGCGEQGRLGEPCPQCIGEVHVVVVPKADDVTDNYMVAVSRLKAERDEFKAQLDELLDMTSEHGDWSKFPTVGKLAGHIHSKLRRALDE